MFAEDIFDGAIGSEVELTLTGARVRQGKLIMIDGDTLMIHWGSGSHVGCLPGDVCITECDATEVIDAKITPA